MHTPRILMVEDEEAVLQLNRKRLEREGYEVNTARSIREARISVWNRPPDLVLLDVLLPDGSGYDFCREVRKISTAPILFLTCLGKDSDVVQGLKDGGDDYLTKPYSLDVLCARISALLRRGGFGGGHVELPPLSVNLQTGRVALSGREIALSPKEVQLLAFLAANAGRSFSADELYEAVWGDSSGVSVKTVKTHISQLRTKLSLDDASVFELSFTPERKYLFLKVRFDPEL